MNLERRAGDWWELQWLTSAEQAPYCIGHQNNQPTNQPGAHRPFSSVFTTLSTTPSAQPSRFDGRLCMLHSDCTAESFAFGLRPYMIVINPLRFNDGVTRRTRHFRRNVRFLSFLSSASSSTPGDQSDRVF